MPTQEQLRIPLRVAALVAGDRVPRWNREVLETIAGSDRMELAWVAASAGAGRARRGWTAHAAYEALDRRLFGSRTDALAPVDVTDLLRGRAPGAMPGDADVVLDLTGGDAELPVPADPRYGVWSTGMGASGRSTRAPYFWEIHDGAVTSGVTLEARSVHGGRTRLLYRSIWATDHSSPHRNHVIACWRLADALIARLAAVQEHGKPALAALAPDPEPGAAPRTDREPTPAELGHHLLAVVRGLARRRVDRLLYQDQWSIAYRRRGGGPPGDASGAGFELLRPPEDRFFADPFVFERDGRHHVFFEEYPYDTGKGVIARVELADGRATEPRVVLERSYHLSYPFVFEDGAEAYMIPETCQNATIELHRAVEFPDTWELDTVLVSGVRAVDATVFRHAGRFWMFATIVGRGRTSQDHLSLFMAPDLHGPWTPHPLNPVVSDVRVARSAGRVFLRDGHLIRPGQDSSGGYGEAVVLNRIEELTELTYREAPIGRIGPDWLGGARGTHTYNFDGDYEVVDVRRRQPRWRRTKPPVRTATTRLAGPLVPAEEALGS